uniref:Fibronectin type-III domain-containing protein n=1 Tax=Latimeria chalumnae TaxID=7897 RepID=H3B719_LATCH
SAGFPRMAATEGAFEMAALGRPFQLGMLYDCRKDILITGITLWDIETLNRGIDKSPQPNTEFHIIASDSIEDKAKALNVDASLKASFLGGLIDVKGSAKYFKDKKTTRQQTRVTLQYRTTTSFEQLTMTHLGRQNVSYEYVLDQGEATHVVTAILYGAQAFFVFDRQVSLSENQQVVQGNLEVMVKKIPTYAAGGEASLKLTDSEKRNAQEFNCTFYGDFALKKNPLTFEEAIETYASLPTLLGEDGEHAVPLRIWLYPLKNLDSRAAQMVCDISLRLINRSQDVLEQLHKIDMHCNDILKDVAALKFPEVMGKIQKFKAICLEYQLEFQKKLTKLLPSIRGGREEEASLLQIIKVKEQSPFKHHLLTGWLNETQREMNLLKSYLGLMDDVEVISSAEELDQVLFDFEVQRIVCFTFTSLQPEDKDPYLSDLLEYLTTKVNKPKMPTQQTKKWFCSPVVLRHVRACAKSFLEIVQANEKARCIITSIPNEDYEGATIYLYEEGNLVTPCFEIPPKPDIPLIYGKTLDSVTLNLGLVKHDDNEMLQCRIEYKNIKGEDWIPVELKDEAEFFTVSGLHPNLEYTFRLSAMCQAGLWIASDPTESVKTPPTS